jgi:hypothetical protein
MPNYLSPGVYVEEVDRGSKPIEAVGTAVAAFVGFTDRAGPVKAPLSQLNEATLITNWGQFTKAFGDFVEGAYLPHAVYGYFLNGGTTCYVTSVKTLGTRQALLPSAIDSKSNSLLITAYQPSAQSESLSIIIKPESTPTSSSESSTAAPSAASDDESKDKDKDKGASGSGSTTSRSPARSLAKDSDVFRLTIKHGDQIIEEYPNLTMGPGDRNVATVVNAASAVVTVEVVPQKGDLTKLYPKADTYPLTNGSVNVLQDGQVKALEANAPQFIGSAPRREGLGGLEALDEVTMVCVPDLMMSYQKGDLGLEGLQTVQQNLLDHCELMRYRFAILDSPPNTEPSKATPDMSPDDILKWRTKEEGFDSKYGALYYPWIKVNDPPTGQNIFVPPCGHIAGIYARNDEQRGVHKAPANEIVRGTVGLHVNVTKGEQDLLNPKGVNCIRAFPGRGIRVWGGRTLSSDGSWRYINVRRLFNMVEESIERGTNWIVFEPNDQNLWAKVRRDVTAFLRLIWRSGALFGNTPEEAFYVKCDEELNPIEVRDAGQLIIEIGMCPVKPAEFVIFRISQWAGPNAEA